MKKQIAIPEGPTTISLNVSSNESMAGYISGMLQFVSMVATFTLDEEQLRGLAKALDRTAPSDKTITATPEVVEAHSFIVKAAASILRGASDGIAAAGGDLGVE